MNTLESIFFFVLALSLLVLVHEWGHYYVARRGGVRVLRFSVGFGPELLGFTKGDTRWSVCAIPFGGYVKFAGDDPEQGRDGASDEFLSKGVGIRSAIVIAGPLMNYILAIVLYGAVIWAEGIRVFPEPRIGSVEETSLADNMGLRVDDVIAAVNGTAVADLLEVDTQLAAVEAGTPFTMTVDRAGQAVDLTGTLEANNPVFGVTFFAPPLVGGVRRDSPAWNAGLREGDLILAVDGEAIDRWSSLQEFISDRPETAVALEFERDGHRLETSVTPNGEKIPDGEGGTETVGRIGILQHIEKESVGPVAALAGGGGWYLVDEVMATISEQDLTKIGNGIPSVVQIHDPQCSRCIALQNETRKAMKAFGGMSCSIWSPISAQRRAGRWPRPTGWATSPCCCLTLRANASTFCMDPATEITWK